MNKIKRICKTLLIVFLVSISLMAQSRGAPSVSTVFAVLTKTVDAKSATVGQELVLITLTDVAVNKEIIIPKASKVIGQITEVSTKGKDEPKCVLAIKIDKAITTSGDEIALQAIIAAVAAPDDNSLSSDPNYLMLHSNEPKMVANPASTASTGDLSASSKASSNAAVATAELKGRMDETLLLNEDSQGAIGYEGISISWSLAVPPPLTLLVSKAKNIKLKAGTQMLLRMATPRLPK